ncbi:MAG TPA: hypothetical protein VMZ69_10725 [Saprospiraceae bacterium]|nr:hypothetical protein [Saprospiraceae bacterium]
MRFFSLNFLFTFFLLVPQFKSGVQNATAIIDGYVLTKDGGAISDALVYLSDNPEFSTQVSTMTNEAGYYRFEGVETMKDYYIKAYKNDHTIDGVSVLDIVRIQKHLLGTKPFKTLDQFIAADANNSWNVSAIDLIELKKLILGIYSEFPSNTSWRFGAMPVDLSGNSIESIKIIQNLNGDERVDFLGIKIGDISGN